MARPSRPRSLYVPFDSVVTVLTLAKTLDAPFCQTRTVPERSAQNSLPSGANARAVAKLAGMEPLGAGSPDCATQALAVGDGVPVTNATVGVATGVGVAVDFVGDPQAATSRARPAAAAIRRRPGDRSADRELRLLVMVRRCDDVEMFAGPCINGIDHALQVDARRCQLVRRAGRHL